METLVVVVLLLGLVRRVVMVWLEMVAMVVLPVFLVMVASARMVTQPILPETAVWVVIRVQRARVELVVPDQLTV